MCHQIVECVRFGSVRRFLLSGFLNTLISYLVYLLLVRHVSHVVAYTAAYVFGIALAYALYRYFVYKASGGRWGVAYLVAAYALQYTVGVGCVALWVSLGGRPALAPLLAIAITTPLMFFLSKAIFYVGNAR